MTRTLIAVLLAVLLGTPAQAQIEPEAATGSRFLKNPDATDTDIVRMMTKDFGDCLFDRRKKHSIALLSASDYITIDYPNIGDAEKMLEDKRLLEFCLGRAMTARQRKVGMRISNTAIRSALVEAAYVGQFRKRDEPIALPASAPEVLPNRYFVAGETMDDARAIAAFADCVVFNATAASHALVHTDPASVAERQVLKAVVPALGGCLPSGRQMELTVPSIRGMVADGLWARSHYGPKIAASESAEQ